MQREEANPSGSMNRIRMRMMTGFCNSRRNVVYPAAYLHCAIEI
jgi:hypothetical protein